MIYKLMPRVHVQWHDVWLGALVTAVLFTVGKFLIGLYIGKSGVASGFGAAGSLIVIFVWVYYSAQIFLLGAEFTWIYARTLGSMRGLADPPAGPEERGRSRAGAERSAGRAAKTARRRAAAGRASTAGAARPRAGVRRPARRCCATSAPAWRSTSPCASSCPACCAASEDRDLEHQRRRPAPAAPARVARRGRSPTSSCLQELKATDADFPARRARGGRLRRRLARPAHLERRRDPRARRRADRVAPRAARRRCRHAGALHRGRGRRRARRLALPAQRQPAARARSSTTSSPGSSG